MSHTRTKASELTAWFGVPDASSLGIALLGADDFAVAHVERPPGGPKDDRITLPASDAYLVTLYLRDIRHNDILHDGAETPVRLYREGSVCLVDLVDGAAIRLHQPLHCLAFYIPRRLLSDIAQLPLAPKATVLRCRRGEDDDTIRHLGAAARALLEAPEKAALEPLRHIGIALGAHLLQHYAARPGSDALSIWAETDAKAFMIEHHAGTIRMSDVADIAGMGQRPFVRRFEHAAGVSPARWLARYRVARAKEFLAEDDLPLAEIARNCGFRGEDQMAMIFRRETGLSPAGWLGRTTS